MFTSVGFRTKINILVVLVIMALVSCIAYISSGHENKDVLQKMDAQSFLDQVSNNKIIVESVFDGPKGLTGVVLQSPTGEKGIGWITDASAQKGSVFIVGGMVLDRAGKNLSVDAYQLRIGTNQAQQPANIGDIDPFTLKGVTFGDGKKTLIAFMDMNCHFCEKLFGLLTMPEGRSVLDKAGVQVRFVPVEILGDDSFRRAASVLQYDNNVAALGALINNYLHNPPAPQVDMIVDSDKYRGLTEVIRLSTAFLKSISPNHIAATPTLLWNGANGRQVLVSGIRGIEDLKKILQDVQ